MNHYPLWKNSLIVVILLLGILYALPNIYERSPVIQTSAIKSQPVDQSLIDKISQTLEDNGISGYQINLENDTVITRFKNVEDQLKGKEIIHSIPGYKSALNLRTFTPDWLSDSGAKAMSLGLDLMGGVYFLMEVDMDAALKNLYGQIRGDSIQILSKARISKQSLRWDNDKLIIEFKTAELASAAYDKLRKQISDVNFKQRNINGVETLVGTVREKAIADIKTKSIEQNISTLKNRVNEFGVSEPVVQRQGSDRIVVQLPGVQDSSEIKDILGSVATLEYRAVHTTESYAPGKPTPIGYKLYYYEGRPIYVSKRIIVSGDQLIDAASGPDQKTGKPQVSVRLNNTGAKRMLDFTKNNVGNNMAVVYKDREFVGIDPETNKKIYKPRETVINNATIQGVFSDRFQTTGLDSMKQASKLALSLRSGSLSAPIDIVREKTIGPSLGKENIEKGFLSVVTGFVVVLIFMLIYYRVFGIVANIALTFNVVLMIAVLSLFGATLTLPGIAGIVLTVGMAVDANILIFERIREELRSGTTPQQSIHSGYAKAFSTIADANVTTFIAAVVLFAFGTGPIKGFAVTLSIGIVTSMFTAIMVSRAIVNFIYGRKHKLKSLSI